MEKRLVISFIFLAIVAVGGYLYRIQPFAENNTHLPLETEEQQVKRAVVAFGTRLRFVPLTAPHDIFVAALERYYKDLVSAEVLDAWKTHQDKTPGAETASPWPDRIEPVIIEREDDGAYTVQAKVIEITSESPRTVNDYPVAIKLRLRDGKWIITGFVKGRLQ